MDYLVIRDHLDGNKMYREGDARSVDDKGIVSLLKEKGLITDEPIKPVAGKKPLKG